MSTRLRTKLVKNLTHEEAKKLRRLTYFKLEGGMRAWFDWLRQHTADYSGEYAPRVWWYEKDGTVLAWGMVQYLADSRNIHGWSEVDQGWWGNIYVRKSCRNRGYGSRLLAHMAAKHPDLHVSPYTRQARSFYATQGFDRLLSGYTLVRS